MKKKVLFAVPTFAGVYPKPFAAFMAAGIAAGAALHDDVEMYIEVIERNALVTAMNQYGDRVLEQGFDCLIVADDDCLIPAHAIHTLYRHFEAGKDFVAAVGYMRGFPHTTTIGKWYPEGRTLIPSEFHKDKKEWRGFGWIDDLTGAPPLLEADFCGVPIAMISRRAFEVTKQPWFSTELDGGSCTHDIFWARRLQDAGIPVLVDTTIRCGHLADAPIVTESSREEARNLMRRRIAAYDAAQQAAKVPA